MGSIEDANPVGTESLLYYAFDAVTLAPIRIPVGARGVVLQIVVPVTQASFCFDYFALRVCKWLVRFGVHIWHPRTVHVLHV